MPEEYRPLTKEEKRNLMKGQHPGDHWDGEMPKPTEGPERGPRSMDDLVRRLEERRRR